MEIAYKHIKVIVGDITKIDCDAIVNAANSTLLGGGGVDGAIHHAAGIELLTECRTLGGCHTGDCKITKAYRLPCRYVIHAVGPIFRDGHHGEQEALASCYQRALTLAKEKEIQTIAFSCISTGVYGYPKEEAARTALQTITTFFKENPDYKLEVSIICFCNSDKEIYDKFMI